MARQSPRQDSAGLRRPVSIPGREPVVAPASGSDPRNDLMQRRDQVV